MIAKRKGVPYLPGSRDGVVKVKKYKTADCVIVGFRWSEKAEGRISTLLLGLYGKNGEIDFVGHRSGFPAAVRRELEEVLPKMQAPGKISDARIPGGQSRWSKGKELDWNPVRPELVCEVRYDKLEKQPLPARDALPPLPPRQGSGAVHVARGAPSAPPRRPDRRVATNDPGPSANYSTAVTSHVRTHAT